MKTSFALAAFTAMLASASPVRRQYTPSGTAAPYPYPSSTGAPYPISSGYPLPSGIPVPSGAPVPSGFPYPPSTTGTSCPVNGAMVCNGPSQFGICNWGQVVWQDVALGTACVDGKIDYAPGFGTQA